VTKNTSLKKDRRLFGTLAYNRYLQRVARPIKARIRLVLASEIKNTLTHGLGSGRAVPEKAHLRTLFTGFDATNGLRQFPRPSKANCCSAGYEDGAAHTSLVFNKPCCLRAGFCSTKQQRRAGTPRTDCDEIRNGCLLISHRCKRGHRTIVSRLAWREAISMREKLEEYLGLLVATFGWLCRCGLTTGDRPRICQFC
jgi:hypothetical protein